MVDNGISTFGKTTALSTIEIGTAPEPRDTSGEPRRTGGAESDKVAESLTGKHEKFPMADTGTPDGTTAPEASTVKKS